MPPTSFVFELCKLDKSPSDYGVFIGGQLVDVPLNPPSDHRQNEGIHRAFRGDCVPDVLCAA